MSNFFDDSGYTLALVCNQKTDPSAFTIHNQSGFIPTHDEIEEFILNLRQRYSQLSKEDISSHNETVSSQALKLKTQVRVGFIPSKGFVYLIKANDTPRYKIGLSTNPFQRIKDLQKICPFPLSILHLIETDDMEGVEKHFHIMFHKYRVIGEWFDLPLDAIDYFANYRLQEPKTKKDYLPLAQALAIHDLMQDGEWRTSSRIAMEAKIPKNRVSHIMPDIKKHWNYESNRRSSDVDDRQYDLEEPWESFRDNFVEDLEDQGLIVSERRIEIISECFDKQLAEIRSKVEAMYKKLSNKYD